MSGNTANDTVSVEAFIPVFDDKLKRIKKRLNSLLNKPKKERDKKAIKALVKEAKELRETLKQVAKFKKKCPNCGHVYDDESPPIH